MEEKKVSFRQKEVTKCPICSYEFHREEMLTGGGRLIAGKLTDELRRLFEKNMKFGKVYPLAYLVTVCPRCYYAAYPRDFLEITGTEIDKISATTQARVNSVKKFFGDVSFEQNRDLLLGALLGRAEQMRARFPGVPGRIYTELASGDWEMLNFYSRNGFMNADAQEEYVMPVPLSPAQTPMGCQLASVPLSSVQEQHAFLQRVNAYRMTPINHDFLTLQMQQPYFMALGFYRGGQPVSEMIMTGGSPQSAALVTLYTRAEYRRKGIARALIARSLRMLKAMNMQEAALTVDSGNASGALGLYESMGYRTYRTLVEWRKALPL